MTSIALIALAWLALIVWILDKTGCQHDQIRGIANYFDDDLQAFVHLKQCDGCGAQFITTER